MVVGKQAAVAFTYRQVGGGQGRLQSSASSVTATAPAGAELKGLRARTVSPCLLDASSSQRTCALWPRSSRVPAACAITPPTRALVSGAHH